MLNTFARFVLVSTSLSPSGGRIVFPSNKALPKKFLQFLNEELIRGAITETLYETNSKREAD